MNPKLQKKLDKRIQEGTLRSLSDFTGFTDFFSNNYLGLQEQNIDIEKTIERTGSRLISGNSALKIEVERKIAEWYGSESALIFNSGYTANLGFFSSVPQKEDLVLFDVHIHASIRDGLKMNNVKSLKYKHCDLADLEKKLRHSNHENKYVVTESLFSMHGTMAPLREIVKLCTEFGASLIVDEAHSSGVFGKEGKGLLQAFDLNDKVEAKIVTFGKAYGINGAAILCSKKMKEYLINFSRPFIYSTSENDGFFVRISNQIMHPSIHEAQRKLHENIAFFRENLNADLISEINSPIQIMQFDDKKNLKEIEQQLQKEKLAVKAIFPPTVLQKDMCLRISIHAQNTKIELEKLLNVLNESLRK